MRPCLVSAQPLLAALLALLSAVPAQATGLRLQAIGPEGEPVAIERAEVLLVAWGDTRVIELPIVDGLVSVDLSYSWLEDRSPRARDTEGAYLYLEADGLAPVRSERFHWIGAYGETSGERARHAEIRFPGGESVTVEPGTAADLTVHLRRPVARWLRLVDEAGRPMTGLGVEMSMFWSRSNHCGALASSHHHPLGRAVADAEGLVCVPDGDFEHAFVFDSGPYWPMHPDALDYLPPRVVTRLTEEVTTVLFHRFEARTIDVWVTRGGAPVSGVDVLTCVARCPCGACCGRTAPVEEGRATLGATFDFYPEATNPIRLIDRATDTLLWEGDPREWPATEEPIQIEIAPGPPG